MRAILTYHSLDESGSPISVSPGAFAAHVRWLAASAVRVVPIEELVRLDTSADAVAITFDDGFANFAEHGAPLLREYGMPGTLFVVSACAGRTNAWQGRASTGIPTLPLLDWDALGSLGESGVELGAHTRTHPSLGDCSLELQREEIEGSADDIAAHTGRRPACFAYPYGVVTERSAQHVRSNFVNGVTTRLASLQGREDPAVLPRLDAYYFRQADGLATWGSKRFRAYIHLRAAIRAIRR